MARCRGVIGSSSSSSLGSSRHSDQRAAAPWHGPSRLHLRVASCFWQRRQQLATVSARSKGTQSSNPMPIAKVSAGDNDEPAAAPLPACEGGTRSGGPPITCESRAARATAVVLPSERVLLFQQEITGGTDACRRGTLQELGTERGKRPLCPPTSKAKTSGSGGLSAAAAHASCLAPERAAARGAEPLRLPQTASALRSELHSHRCTPSTDCSA